MSVPRVPLYNVHLRVGRMEAFTMPPRAGQTTGSVWAERVAPGHWSFSGQLPDRYRDLVRLASYIVYSYATPIAWFIEGTPSDLSDVESLRAWLDNGEASGAWVMPAVRYSVTTSKHQGKTRQGMHLSGVDNATEWDTRDYRKFDRVTSGGW